MQRVQQIKDSTWCLNAQECIPFFFINDNDIVLLDSGHQDPDWETIKSELLDQGLNIKAVISSHTHVDHAGNNKRLQSEYGTEIISSYIEDAFASSSTSAATLYRIVSPYDMDKYFPNMVCKADRVFLPTDKSIQVQGCDFKLYYLPGHTAGHTAIETPDGVLYLGDSIVSDDVVENTKMLTIMNWIDDAASKKQLYSMNHSHYVFAHKGVSTDIRGTIENNEKKKESIASFVVQNLLTKEAWNISEIEQKMWNAFELHTSNYIRQAVYRRNLINCVEYLVYCGKLSREIINGTAIYKVI